MITCPLTWIPWMLVHAESISFAMAQSSHNSEIYNIGALVHMCSGYVWTMKSWQRSEWRLGFNSVYPTPCSTELMITERCYLHFYFGIKICICSRDYLLPHLQTASKATPTWLNFTYILHVFIHTQGRTDRLTSMNLLLTNHLNAKFISQSK